MKAALRTVSSSIALALCAACAGGGSAMTSPGEPAPVERSEAASTETPATPGRSNGEVAMDTLKGAGKGALVCATPLGVGLKAGPIGGVVGGYLSFVCLPFGVAVGALVGATGATNHSPQTQVETAQSGSAQ